MPRLQIDLAEPLHSKTDEAWHSLVIANDDRLPEVMVRGTELVRITERGELEPLNVDSLADRLSETAGFGMTGTDKSGAETWQPKDPPMAVCRALLARDSARYEGAARVDRVSDVPFLTAEGVAAAPGVHGSTYYRPAEGLEGVEGAPETTEDVEQARELLLDEYLGDFRFADEASRAHALALLLLPFVRDYVAGPTPLHAVLAPRIGSGKTYLAQACLIPGCGLVAATPQAGSEDEVRKRITSSLLEGARAVFLDNLDGTLDSGAMAAALTTGQWKDRVLGESRMVALPVRNAWVATGNNLGFSPEIARRTVPIFLDPGEVAPADRASAEFRHPDLLEWGVRNRRRLVAAALTLVEHWHRGPAMVEGGYIYVRSGDDPVLNRRKTVGSFTAWSHVMSGILDAAGIPGFLENRERWTVEADDESRDAAAFLAALKPVAEGEGTIRFHQLKDEVRIGGRLHALAPEGIGDMREDRLHKALESWLRRFKGKRVGALELRNLELGGNGNPRGWYVFEHQQQEG